MILPLAAVNLDVPDTQCATNSVVTKYPAYQTASSRRTIALLLHEEPGQRMFDSQQRQVVVFLCPVAVGSEADMTAVKSRFVLRGSLASHHAFIRLHAFLHKAKESF